MAFRSSYERKNGERGQRNAPLAERLPPPSARSFLVRTHIHLISAINRHINVRELVDIAEVEAGLDDQLLRLEAGGNVPVGVKRRKLRSQSHQRGHSPTVAVGVAVRLLAQALDDVGDGRTRSKGESEGERVSEVACE